MKKIILLLTAILMSFGVMAQTVNCVSFSSKMTTLLDDQLSEKSGEALKVKIEQILSRNKVLTSSRDNIFVIVPELTVVSDESAISGVRAMFVVKAELTLRAINSVDGNTYGSTMVNLVGSGTSRQAAIDDMVTSIRVTNPAFVKFIKNASQSIIDYYTHNPEKVVTQVELLVADQKFDELRAYILSVPNCTPSYEATASFRSALVAPVQVEATHSEP